MFAHLLRMEARRLCKHPFLWAEIGVLVFIFTTHCFVRYLLVAEAVRQGLVNTGGLETDLQVGCL